MEKIRIIFLAIFLVLFQSCIVYKDRITYNEDFSGKAEVKLIVPPFVSKELEKSYTQIKLKEGTEEKGVKILKVNKTYEANNVIYTFVLSFRSPEALRNFSVKDFVEGKKLFNIKLTREKEKIHWERVLEFDKKDKKPLSEDEQALAALLGGYVWEFRVSFPYRVMKTNGNLQEDKRTVVWQYDLYSLMSMDRVVMLAELKEPSLFEKILRFLGIER